MYINYPDNYRSAMMMLVITVSHLFALGYL